MQQHSLIPFKAKAWMDLTDRKAAGEQVDSKNIKNHKNDVFRLTELIDPTVKVAAPKGVFLDIQEFIKRMQDENVDIKQLGLVEQNEGTGFTGIKGNVYVKIIIFCWWRQRVRLAWLQDSSQCLGHSR